MSIYKKWCIESLLGSGRHPSAFPFYLFDQSAPKWANFCLGYIGNALVGNLEPVNFRLV